MCQSITMPDGRIIDSLGAAREEFGDVPMLKDYFLPGVEPNLDGENCLCPVDIEAMIEWYEWEDRYGDYKLIRHWIDS